MNNPFGSKRNRTLTIVAVVNAQFVDGKWVGMRSEQHQMWYIIEASARPLAYGFLVPGVETTGHFVKFVIEAAAAARAQVRWRNPSRPADDGTY